MPSSNQFLEEDYSSGFEIEGVNIINQDIYNLIELLLEIKHRRKGQLSGT